MADPNEEPRPDEFELDEDGGGPVKTFLEHLEDLRWLIAYTGGFRSGYVTDVQMSKRRLFDEESGREVLAGTTVTITIRYQVRGLVRVAKLVMTGEEILDSGVQVMAQPPGKKNQTIHLLSGGEKALTAIALVFAIFQLNPAPFCLLDEVDAPLDDANVDRFCKLLETISGRTETRFVVVTHHRMTMARMDRLFGVTMAERGVSRLVSVDLKAAEEMRDVA